MKTKNNKTTKNKTNYLKQKKQYYCSVIDLYRDECIVFFFVCELLVCILSLCSVSHMCVCVFVWIAIRWFPKHIIRQLFCFLDQTQTPNTTHKQWLTFLENYISIQGFFLCLFLFLFCTYLFFSDLCVCLCVVMNVIPSASNISPLVYYCLFSLVI